MTCCYSDEMTHVQITTGARLHFGPLSVSSPEGGKFGGVGLMIDAPGVELTARSADLDSILGDEETTRRVSEFVRRIHRTNPGSPYPACEIKVVHSIPSHRGLGSGTQLGLAVAQALSAIANESRPTLPTLARRVGRGLRSAIGLHGFALGGFLVDGGRPKANEVGTLVTRVEFPVEWRIVLAAPLEAIGLSGAAEESTFASQPPMPSALTGELCSIVLLDWLPAVINHDFPRCSNALFQFGHSVGQFFSAAQGGVFACPRMIEWAELVRRGGIQGVAQTSWGPTLAALCPDSDAARQLQQDFAHDPAWSDCIFEIATPLNRGATIRVA